MDVKRCDLCSRHYETPGKKLEFSANRGYQICITAVFSSGRMECDLCDYCSAALHKAALKHQEESRHESA